MSFNVTGISPAAGPIAGGTSVVISGTAFTTSTTVTVGGTACTTLTFTSSTSLTCVTPNRGSTGAVTLLVTEGSSMDSETFTYTTNPAPTVSTISPSSTDVSSYATQSITITGSGFVSTPSVTVGGTTCSSVSYTSSTSISCTAPRRLYGGSVDVVVTNPDTQTGTKSNGYTYNGNTTYTLIKNQIWPNVGCSGCHSSTSCGASSAFGISQYSYISCKVSAGNSSGSTLYIRVAGSTGGTRMPQGGSPRYMTSEELAALAQWIDNGATDN